MEDRILYRFVAYLFQSHFSRRKAPFLILKVISAIFYSLTIACFDNIVKLCRQYFFIFCSKEINIYMFCSAQLFSTVACFLLFKICDAIPKDNRIKYSTISNASPLENVYMALHCNLIKMDIVLFSPMLKK